jgi:hypothetical protein
LRITVNTFSTFPERPPLGFAEQGIPEIAAQQAIDQKTASSIVNI